MSDYFRPQKSLAALLHEIYLPGRTTTKKINLGSDILVLDGFLHVMAVVFGSVCHILELTKMISGRIGLHLLLHSTRSPPRSGGACFGDCSCARWPFLQRGRWEWRRRQCRSRLDLRHASLRRGICTVINPRALSFPMKNSWSCWTLRILVEPPTRRTSLTVVSTCRAWGTLLTDPALSSSNAARVMVEKLTPSYRKPISKAI